MPRFEDLSKDYLDMIESQKTVRRTTQIKKLIETTIKQIDNLFSNEPTPTTYDILKSEMKETTCSICLEEYNDDDNILLISCGHIFHEICFTKWNKGCPICHKIITI